MNHVESIRHQYSTNADSYRTSNYHSSAPDLEVLREVAQLQGTERVLDIGTGTGHTALAVAQGANHVVGIDLTPQMLEQARQLAAERQITNVTFEEGDAQRLRYEDDSFDVVTCRVCAHHFADPLATVCESARVLRPGGCILWLDSVVPADPAQDTFLNTIELLRDPSHVRDFSISQWQAMFAEVGLAAEVAGQWATDLPFDDWTDRQSTAEEARVMLRQLFHTATSAVREAFRIRTDPYAFDIPIVLLRAS